MTVYAVTTEYWWEGDSECTVDLYDNLDVAKQALKNLFRSKLDYYVGDDSDSEYRIQRPEDTNGYKFKIEWFESYYIGEIVEKEIMSTPID